MARVLVRRPWPNSSNSSKGVQCVHSARDVAMESRRVRDCLREGGKGRAFGHENVIVTVTVTAIVSCLAPGTRDTRAVSLEPCWLATPSRNPERLDDGACITALGELGDQCPEDVLRPDGAIRELCLSHRAATQQRGFAADRPWTTLLGNASRQC